MRAASNAAKILPGNNKWLQFQIIDTSQCKGKILNKNKK